MSVAELKEKLKAAGLSQIGDKPTLVFRLKLFATAKEYNMNYDGINVCQLKAGDLKSMFRFRLQMFRFHLQMWATTFTSDRLLSVSMMLDSMLHGMGKCGRYSSIASLGRRFKILRSTLSGKIRIGVLPKRRARRFNVCFRVCASPAILPIKRFEVLDV